MGCNHCAMTAADLALDNQLCFALHAASRRVTAAYRPLLDEVGLTYPQYVVMLALWEHDGVTVRDLGTRLFLDSGTLSPLLVRLEEAGLLSRSRQDPDDGRRLTVSLTPAGTPCARRPNASTAHSTRRCPWTPRRSTRCAPSPAGSSSPRTPQQRSTTHDHACLLYTSDAADDLLCVDL